MTDQPLTGPRLTDFDFFTQVIDTTRPGLEAIPALVKQGDFAAARRVFAAEARASLQPERYLATVRPGRRENTYMYPGESFEEAAERILRLELISCGVPMKFEGDVDWFANPTYNQYREWTWQLSRHWEWDVLAELYRQNPDERYAAGFVRLFQSWVRQAVVPENAAGNETLCWRTIETGIRMGRPWPRALHTFYQSPNFTDDVLVDWYKSVWEHGWRLRNFHRTHNWLIMEMNGLLHVGILYPQFRDSPAWLDYAIKKLERELDTQVYADGMQFELSTGYHQVNIRNYLLAWHTMEAYGVPVPDKFRAVLEKMHSANVRLMMPDGRLPDVNDGGWHRVAALLDDAVKNHPERADFKWVHSGGAEGSPPAETSLAFDYCGYYVMRTGWQPDSIWAFFDGGHIGYAHQHEDKLNLLLHAYGRLLLTEAGNYAYDASEMRKYGLSTRGHNTVRVDGLDQNRKTAFYQWLRQQPTEEDIIRILNTPNEATWHVTAAYDLAEAAYDEGYGADAARIASHRRKVIFLKQPPAPLLPCFLVIDRLLPLDDRPHHYQARWHFNTDTATISPDNPLAVISQDADHPNLAVIVADRPDVSVQIFTGQEEPEWVGWKSYGQVQGNHLPAPTAEYAWLTAGAHRSVTLLYPLPAGAACPVVHVTAGSAADDGSITLTLRDGGKIDLPEEEFPVA
ncbi:MAG TPA: alginate lyase family protein [Spirillospora sp.]|nr:alginate lyase family protein [Spirillospora sp.]